MKHSSTKNIINVINSGFVGICDIQIIYPNNALCPPSETVEEDKFIHDITVLNDSGIFSDTVTWKYEEIGKAAVFKIYGEDFDKICNGIIEVYLRVNDIGNLETVKEMLTMTIFDEISNVEKK